MKYELLWHWTFNPCFHIPSMHCMHPSEQLFTRVLIYTNLGQQVHYLQSLILLWYFFYTWACFNHSLQCVSSGFNVIDQSKVKLKWEKSNDFPVFNCLSIIIKQHLPCFIKKKAFTLWFIWPEDIFLYVTFFKQSLFYKHIDWPWLMPF